MAYALCLLRLASPVDRRVSLDAIGDMSLLDGILRLCNGVVITQLGGGVLRDHLGP